MIFDVRPSDEGFYFCTAVNDKGKRTSVMGQVNVWSEYLTYCLIP